ncbi:conjugal transfer protein [Streptococcus sobrinus]|uniref:conjugal transfer protein n=1 Tax=Streptococcus sobrinus TaxID=1310 RepID=UPI0002E973D2|nr:conjugal transfer protein [Streptococcus sobrinus]
MALKIRKPSKKKLRKKEVKQKHKMKVVSQRKMNLIFIGGLAIFFGLATLSIGLNIYGQTHRKAVTAKVSTTDVDYRLQMFLDGYVNDYFTWPSDSEGQEEQIDKLNDYYNFVPTEKSQGQIKTTMSLDSARMQSVKNNVATYRVTYKVGDGDSAKTVTIDFSIPFAGSSGKYYVTGLPWYEAVGDFKDGKADKKSTELQLSQKDDLSESERNNYDSFMKLFFDDYTTSQKNLNLISKGLKTINGATYKSLDYSYYKVHKNGSISAYVQVTFEISGVTHSENFSFELSKKGDSYFVNKMSHTIPVGYDKDSQSK